MFWGQQLKTEFYRASLDVFASKRCCEQVSLNKLLPVNPKQHYAGQKNLVWPTLSFELGSETINQRQPNTGTQQSLYFLGAAVGTPEPRIVLKNSDEGSSNMTSLFLLKLAL